MNLKILRQYLDTMDTAIKYILVQRMSIIPLVAQYKIENNLPTFQPKREQEMYEKMGEFSVQTGLNSKLISEIFKLIMDDAVRAQNEMKEKGKNSPENEGICPNTEELMKQSLERLKEFIGLMDEIKSDGLASGNKTIDNFTCFYREKSV